MLRWVRAFYLFASHARYVPAPEWTDEDSANLAKFLTTASGIKLRMKLEANIAAMNEEATFKSTAYACGWARGYRALWAYFQALSPARELSGDPEVSSDGGAEDFAQYNP